LSFADSSSEPWQTTDLPNNSENPGPITLTVTNYVFGKTKLRFGTDANGLTATQLAQIRFADFGNAPGRINASGFLTPDVLAITTILKGGGTVRITWASVNGRNYRVQHKENLEAAAWTDFTPDVAATTATTRSGPLQDLYQAMLARGMRPELARVTLTRKLAALTLRLWKTGERYDPAQLTVQAR
jgi:hypothetical protein